MMHHALTQWQLVQNTRSITIDSQLMELIEDFDGVIGQLVEASTVILSWAQVVASFLSSLPHLDWPESFVAIAEAIGVLTLDLGFILTGEPVSDAVGDSLHAAATTLLQACAMLVLLITIPIAARLLVVQWGSKRVSGDETRRGRRLDPGMGIALLDRSVQLVVGIAFLIYPVMCKRLLMLFHLAQYNQVWVLSSDVRLTSDELLVWQLAAAPFVALYVVGIPVAFVAALWYGVRPALFTELSHTTAKETMAWERSCLLRYGLLYVKYEPRAYWYELVELLRKLLLTGVMIFVSPGGSAQIYFGVMVSLGTVMLLTRLTPYANDRIDVVSWVTQLSTLLTLMCALAIHARFDEEVAPDFLEAILVTVVVVQLLPVLAMLWLLGMGLRDARQARRAKRGISAKASHLPAVVRDLAPKDPPPCWRGFSCCMRRLRLLRWTWRQTSMRQWRQPRAM